MKLGRTPTSLSIRDILAALDNGLSPTENFKGEGNAGEVLVSQGPDAPPMFLPQGSSPPTAHVLATTVGLGLQHTVSGLTAGQVLRASGATTAAFASASFADITGVAGKTQLPAVVAYEDKANVFSALQTFSAGIDVTVGGNISLGSQAGKLRFQRGSASQVNLLTEANTFGDLQLSKLLASFQAVIGTDPGGPEALRVGGSARFSTGVIVPFNVPYRSGDSLGATIRLLQIGADDRVYIGALDAIAGVGGITFRADGTNSMLLEGSALTPATAGLLTLGTGGASGLGWGGAFVRVPSGSAGYVVGTASKEWTLYPSGSDLRLFEYTSTFGTGGNDRITFYSGGDLGIGSLGRFDSTDVPTEGQLLIYKTGSINKWQAESLNAIWGDTDFKAAILADGAVTYILFDPGSGADSPVGLPPTPGALTVTQQHGTHTIEIRNYIKPSDFRFFAWEYSKNGTDWIALTTSTSSKIVHSRLPFDGTTFRYRMYVIDRAGNSGIPSPVAGPFTPIRTGETHAFGAVIAGEIAVANLAAITATMGILTSGQIRGPGNIHGINFSGAGGIPGTWVSGINFENTTVTGMTRYINFNSTAHNNFIKTERLTIGHDGTVEMYQTSAQPLFKLDATDFLLQNDAVSPTQGLLVDGTLPATWTRYFNLNGAGSMVKHEKFEINYDGSMKMLKKVIILTSGTSWAVPADFNPFLNSIELIGGGGGGAGGVTNTRGGGGGGAGGYSKIVAFNPGGASSITYAIGVGGTGGASGGGSGGNGGQTSWNNGTVTASGGTGGVSDLGQVGGAGNTFSGGAGGNGSQGTGTRGGGGGGGAAGPHRNGAGGSAASVGTGGAGGAGGGPAGGAGGAAGAPGGDGSGWTANPGGATAGAGGGGGGGSGIGGGGGGNFGAGGGGSGSTSGSSSSGGAGKPGAIVITYFPIGEL